MASGELSMLDERDICSGDLCDAAKALLLDYQAACADVAVGAATQIEEQIANDVGEMAADAGGDEVYVDTAAYLLALTSPDDLFGVDVDVTERDAARETLSPCLTCPGRELVCALAGVEKPGDS